MTRHPPHLRIFLPPSEPEIKIYVPPDAETYRQGALEELRKQLGNCRTENRREKIMARIEYWEEKK